tara:strand:+ start:386 stop:1054 length:669 start_codon:yes stop_codon:yes gene_type:complete
MRDSIKSLLQKPLFTGIEFFILCIALPSWIIYSRSGTFMFSFLWGACLYCIIIYRLCYFKTHKDLWHWNAVTKDNMHPIIIRWVLASIAMLAFTLFYDPERLFYIPLQRPQIIPALLIAYPLISALPQEFIFCSFFFRRYESFFGKARLMIFASAIIFAYAHILYINPVAPTLGFIGGLIFATTYFKTKSLALVTIEHGLYGNSLFLIGLGWYFYSGSIAAQ